MTTTNPMRTIADQWNIQPQHPWMHGQQPEQSVVFDEKLGKWDVYGYQDCQRVMSDTTAFSNDTKRLYSDESVNEHKEGNLIQMDEPEHRKLRGLVSHAFAPKIVADLEPRIHKLTHELLDQVSDRDEIELVADLAYPLPIIVITELLGVPSSDRDLFKKWVSVMFENTARVSLVDQEEAPEPGSGSLKEKWQPMFDYVRQHAQERKRRPRQDLLSQLVGAKVNGEGLTDTEVVNFAILLLVVGHVTTTMLLGNTLLCLDARPEWMKRVREDRLLLPGVLEEAVRLLSPVPAIARSTRTEVEIAGQKIGKDQLVMVWIGAANRDERQFANPAEFDPTRDPNPHLGYGRGIHFCLGAPLARMEGRVAMNILLDRFPKLRTDPDNPPTFIPSADMTGVTSLPLRTR